MPKKIYTVYVIELSRKVFTESARFRNANPQFNGVLECLYVGMTSKTPKERLEQHKEGYKSTSSIVLLGMKCFQFSLEYCNLSAMICKTDGFTPKPK